MKYPIGFAAAEADWSLAEGPNPRPYTLDLWNQLTFGEQQRYGAQECKTKGAVYSITTRGLEISATVKLPTSLAGSGFSEAEAKWIEAALHKKIEETVHWILVARNKGLAP